MKLPIVAGQSAKPARNQLAGTICHQLGEIPLGCYCAEFDDQGNNAFGGKV
jgi:hypothetical protein